MHFGRPLSLVIDRQPPHPLHLLPERLISLIACHDDVAHVPKGCDRSESFLKFLLHLPNPSSVHLQRRKTLVVRILVLAGVFKIAPPNVNRNELHTTMLARYT